MQAAEQHHMPMRGLSARFSDTCTRRTSTPQHSTHTGSARTSNVSSTSTHGEVIDERQVTVGVAEVRRAVYAWLNACVHVCGLLASVVLRQPDAPCTAVLTCCCVPAAAAAAAAVHPGSCHGD